MDPNFLPQVSSKSEFYYFRVFQKSKDLNNKIFLIITVFKSYLKFLP